jgi:hypothetical protein
MNVLDTCVLEKLLWWKHWLLLMMLSFMQSESWGSFSLFPTHHCALCPGATWST